MKKLGVVLAIVFVASFAFAQSPKGQGVSILNGGIVEVFTTVPGAGPTPYGPGLGRHDLMNPTTNSPLGCETCHLPHTAPTYGAAFLWAWKNLPLQGVTTYDTEGNPSHDLAPLAAPGNRFGAARSLLCLSCHDATTANANGVAAYQLLATGAANNNGLTTQHPVDATVPTSGSYEPALLVSGSMLNSADSATAWIGVDTKLPLWDGTKVECSSCHDQHNDYVGNVPGGGGVPFLRWANINGTALCRQCHRK